MKYRCLLVVIALSVFGVSAEPCGSPSFPVRLNNYGPGATTIPVLNSHVQTRILERMPLRTAGCVPQPRTVANTCTCIKTVVKPRVHNQIISVPSVQRIIQTTATPVVEKIHYQATPVEPPVCSYPAAGLLPTCLNFNGFQTRLIRPGCASFLSVPSCAANAIFI